MSVIKPIRTDEDLDAALGRIEEIFNAVPDTPEDYELGVLLDLVEHYEDRRYPIGSPDPVVAIEFEMDQRGLTRRDLVPYIGSPARVAAVLSRQEDITMPMARALHKHLGIDAKTLLQEPSVSLEGRD